MVWCEGRAPSRHWPGKFPHEEPRRRAAASYGGSHRPPLPPSSPLPAMSHVTTAAPAAVALGQAAARYGVALTLLAIGLLKFTAGEAEGIRRLIETSPLLRWMYAVWDVRGASGAIGVV